MKKNAFPINLTILIKRKHFFNIILKNQEETKVLKNVRDIKSDLKVLHTHKNSNPGTLLGNASIILERNTTNHTQTHQGKGNS